MPGRVCRWVWGSAPLLLSLASFTWCTNTVMVRGIGHDIPPMGLAFWRMVVASAVAGAMAPRALLADLPAMLRQWKLMLLLGATGIGGFNLLIYIGLQTTTALNTVLLQSVIPVTILAAAALLYREMPSPRQLLAIAVSMLGVMVIVGQGSLMQVLRLQVVSGDVWVFSAMLVYGFYSVLLRRLPALHPLSFLAGSFAAAGLILAPAAAWEWYRVGPVPATVPIMLVCLYLAVVPSIVAYLFFNRGVALLGPGRAGQYMHLVPVFGSLLAVTLLGEAFGPYLLVGIGLIAAGLALAGAGGARVGAAMRLVFGR